MSPPRMNLDLTLQAAQQIEAGTTVAELAEGWGISRGAIYGAFARHGIEVGSSRTSWNEHLELQRESQVPPELYAYRAEISFASLRRAAWVAKVKLTMNSYAERAQFWRELLAEFDPAHAKAFMAAHFVPVTMTAYWYHKLNKPEQLLLWGFTQLLEVHGDQFADVSRFHDSSQTEFVLGKGKTCAHINAHIASEVFKHTTPLVLAGVHH